METKSGISFGFSKKVENKKLESSSISEHQEQVETSDLITSVEGSKVIGSKPEAKSKEYVIPLIKQNRWKQSEDTNSEDGQAVQELLEDIAKQNEEWKDRGTVSHNISIPLLMQNKVPEGYETDDKLDVSLRPNEPDEADYEVVPIEQYGLAMLKGMGWKEGQGIGKHEKAVAPVVATLRPKGMGLGADRSQLKQLNHTSNSTKEDSKEELILKRGAYCVMLKGSNKDLYGVIEGLDEDNCRVMIKLTLSGKIVSQSQYGIKLVTEKEFKKYSKYLNKGKADEYKEREEKKSRHSEKSHHKHSKRRRSRSRERRSRSRDNHDRKKDKRSRSRSPIEDREEQLQERIGFNSGNEKSLSSENRKRKYEDRNDRYISNGSSKTNFSWIRPHIRVRLIDKNYKKGRYYKEKVTVLDLAGPNNCICKTDDGKLLEDIPSSSLETVIPKSDSAYVLIVNGKQKGKVAQIMKKDKKTCQAVVQLVQESEFVLKLSYDDICEYSGDIHDF